MKPHRQYWTRPDLLSLEILAGKFREGDAITADAQDGKVVFSK